jgi:acetyl-CoA C-acetyltransferase
VDEVDHFDFYSCFPVAVEMACEMLGLAEDDPRGLTVTGGLPYFGGPGNEYTLHALATMVEGVRSTPGTKGLVTGNGWYLTKHAATVVASGPRDGGLPAQRREDEGVVPETTASTESAEGDATLETYTVVFDREGAPLRGIVLGRTDEGRRFVANTPEDRLLLEAFVAAEEVGRRGRVSHRDGRNLFDPA